MFVAESRTCTIASGSEAITVSTAVCDGASSETDDWYVGRENAGMLSFKSETVTVTLVVAIADVAESEALKMILHEAVTSRSITPETVINPVAELRLNGFTPRAPPVTELKE